MLSIYVVVALVLDAVMVNSLSLNEVAIRNFSPDFCSAIEEVVKILKTYKATPFCSSFLHVPTKTSTDFVSITDTAVVTSGTATTSYIFLPGNPPGAARRDGTEQFPDGVSEFPQFENEHLEKRGLPPFLTTYATQLISSACSCLSIPPPTTTVDVTKTNIVTKTVPPPVVTSTIYPCQTSSILYGVTSGSFAVSGSGNGNGLYQNLTSAQACCEFCFFQVQYCINAYFYFYEGCVVDTATPVAGSGQGINSVCPSGTVSSLTYEPDVTCYPFRSTGDIAGPCGRQYNDIPTYQGTSGCLPGTE